MSVFEVIGYFVVIFLACVGTHRIAQLVLAGLHSHKGALDIGQLHSDSAVREYLDRSIR